jgi:hypothetical protein
MSLYNFLTDQSRRFQLEIDEEKQFVYALLLHKQKRKETTCFYENLGNSCLNKKYNVYTSK